MNIKVLETERSRLLAALSLSLGGLLMGGCSSYSSSFDCPYGKGAGCSSVSRVNTMIDNQQIDLGEGELGTPASIKMKNIQIFYGPERLSKIVTVQEPLAD